MRQVFYTNAKRHQFLSVLPDLIRSRELLLDLVWKDVRVRYRYAAMGLLWAVLEPLIMMLVLTFVFSIVIQAKVEQFGIDTGRGYAVFVLSGLIPWQFFATGLSSATRSLVDNRNLVKKVYFPREVVPLSAIGVALVNLAIGALLLIVVFVVLMGQLPGPMIAIVPLVFLIQLGIVGGLGLLFAAANATYRDVAYMVDAAILFGFYATPIIYPPEWVKENWSNFYGLYMLNPMAGLVTSYRQILFNNELPEPALLAWPLVFAILSIIAGLWVFRRRSPLLADTL